MVNMVSLAADGTYLLEPEYDNIYSLGFIGDTEYFEFTNHLGELIL